MRQRKQPRTVKRDGRWYDTHFKRYVGLTPEENKDWEEYNKKHGLPKHNRHSKDTIINQKIFGTNRSKK